MQHYLKNIVVLHTGYSTDNHGVRFGGFRLAGLLFFSEYMSFSPHDFTKNEFLRIFNYQSKWVYVCCDKVFGPVLYSTGVFWWKKSDLMRNSWIFWIRFLWSHVVSSSNWTISNLNVGQSNVSKGNFKYSTIFIILIT